MSDDNACQIAEVKQRITALEIGLKKDVSWLRREIALISETHDRALDLARKETDRRLDLLNGEAERLRMMQTTYLPREVAETALAAMEKAIARQGIIAAVAAAIVAAAFTIKAFVGG